MKMIREILETALRNKSLIGVTTDEQEVGESIIGFIIKTDELYFKINEINEYGFFIGCTVIEIEKIINIDVNDRYQRRLKFIHDNLKSLNINNRVTVWKKGYKLITLFKELEKERKLTTFYLDDDEYVVGYIIKLKDEMLEIKNIGREGDEDGVSYHLINNFIGVRYDGLEEQKIKLLYENKLIF